MNLNTWNIAPRVVFRSIGQSTRFTCLILLFSATAVRAQEKAPSLQPAEAAPTTPSQEKAVESIQKAKAILDEMDANLAEAPTPEQLAEVDRLIAEVQAADPANVWVGYLMGRSYGIKGRNGDAIDQLRKFVSTREGRTDWIAHRVLGDLFVAEFPRLAKASYEKAAELMPNEPSVLTGLANCANRSGNLDEGVRLARQAAEADGYKNVRYAHRLARALMTRQEWSQAEQEAEKGLRVAEERVARQPGNRTHLQVLAEQYSLFIEIYTNQISNTASPDPQLYIRLVDAMNHRADVLNKLSRHEQIAVLESGISRNPDNAPVLLRIKYAEVLAAAGRDQDAIAQYERILGQDAENQAAAEGLRRLREAAPPPSP